MSNFQASKESVTALKVGNLSVRYGGVEAVKRISFEVASGSVVGLLGPNGAGKSSLLRALAGVVRPSAGYVRLGREDIGGWPTYRVCRAGMAMTNQTPRPFASMTVLEHLQIAARFGNAQRSCDVPWILNLCHLQDSADVLASGLTLSQLRRLELARAIATGPSVMLIDEIAAGLPTDEMPRMIDSVQRLRESGVTLIVVEHVMDLLLSVTDRLVCLEFGQIIADGTPQVVVEDERVVEAYFGDPPRIRRAAK